jgi:hypothetical protein
MRLQSIRLYPQCNLMIISQYRWLLSRQIPLLLSFKNLQRPPSKFLRWFKVLTASPYLLLLSILLLAITLWTGLIGLIAGFFHHSIHRCADANVHVLNSLFLSSRVDTASPPKPSTMNCLTLLRNWPIRQYQQSQIFHGFLEFVEVVCH